MATPSRARIAAKSSAALIALPRWIGVMSTLSATPAGPPDMPRRPRGRAPIDAEFDAIGAAEIPLVLDDLNHGIPFHQDNARGALIWLRLGQNLSRRARVRGEDSHARGFLRLAFSFLVEPTPCEPPISLALRIVQNRLGFHSREIAACTPVAREIVEVLDKN
jgi:hypothetical protein